MNPIFHRFKSNKQEEEEIEGEIRPPPVIVAGFYERAVAAALIWLRDIMVTPSEASRHGGSGLEEIWKRELGPSRPRFFARRVGGSEVSVFFDRAAPSLFQNPIKVLLLFALPAASLIILLLRYLN